MRKRKSREKMWFGEGDYKKNFAEEGWLIIIRGWKYFKKRGDLTRNG